MLIEENAGDNNKGNQDTSNSVNILLYFVLVCFQCIFVFIVEVIWNIHFLFCFVHVTLGIFSCCSRPYKHLPVCVYHAFLNSSSSVGCFCCCLSFMMKYRDNKCSCDKSSLCVVDGFHRLSLN